MAQIILESVQNKPLYNFLANISTLLLVPFASKLINYFSL